MGINWDQHLLAPLQAVFGDPVNYRPADDKPTYTISGIFDRAYITIDTLDDGSTINTTNPVLGVRDSEFRSPPKQGDRVFIGIVANEPVNTLFVVADVQPDSHGGSKLILNRTRS